MVIKRSKVVREGGFSLFFILTFLSAWVVPGGPWHGPLVISKWLAMPVAFYGQSIFPAVVVIMCGIVLHHWYPVRGLMAGLFVLPGLIYAVAIYIEEYRGRRIKKESASMP